MIFNALLICVLFLALFALALWPVLFRSSKYKTAILTGANVLFAVLTFACWVYVRSSSAMLERQRTDCRFMLAEAADVLECHTVADDLFPKVLQREQTVSKDMEDIDRFFADIHKLHVQYCGEMKTGKDHSTQEVTSVTENISGPAVSNPVNMILLAFLIVSFSLVFLQPDFSGWNKLSLIVNPALLAWIVVLLYSKSADESRFVSDVAPVVHAVCSVASEQGRPLAKIMAEKMRDFSKADGTAADWKMFYENNFAPVLKEKHAVPVPENGEKTEEKSK